MANIRNAMKEVVANVGQDVAALNESLDGVVVIVNGGIVAWFAYHDQASRWASDNYFGRWLMTSYSIPLKPLFTDEQIKAAEEKAKEWSEFFNTNCE